MKKIIILMLALMIVLCSCSKDEADVKEPDITTSVVTFGDSDLEIPLSADFGGEEFYILTSGCGGNCNDFMFEEDSPLALDSAQYKRKMKVENDYGVKIIETELGAGNTSGSGKGFMEISNAVNSGICKYDLALIGGYDVATLAYNGYLYDMNSVGGIDLSKSWWDKNATESLSIDGTTFFTTGEITVSRADSAFCIMYNKKLANDYNIPSPYDMVKDGSWTIENFANLCKTITEDVNQDDIMDDNDRYGLLVLDDSVVGIINAAGGRCATVNEDGEIELTLYTESNVSALEKFFDIAFNKQYALTYQRYGSGRIYEDKLWQEDHGLFWTSYMKMIPRYRSMESDFGILPYPKFSETQQEYSSTIFPYASQFICVPLVQNDLYRTGIVTEALAYYGQKIVTPVYYDVNLVGQSVRDEESVDMLNIILDSLVYDIGYYYQIGPYNKHLIYMIRENDSNFVTRYESNLPAANAQLDQINEAYKKVTATWK